MSEQQNVDQVRLREYLRTHGGALDESDLDGQREFVDTFLAAARAKAWDEALDHAWELADPLHSVLHTDDTEVVVRSDIRQARAENRYRASSSTSEGSH